MLKAIIVQPFLDPKIRNVKVRSIVRIGVDFPVYNRTRRIPTDLENSVIITLEM